MTFRLLRRARTGALATACLLPLLGIAQPVSYTLRDIGQMDGELLSPMALGDAGHVVGNTQQSSRGFTTDPNGKRIHATPTLGGSMTLPRGVNKAGRYVGEALLAGDQDQRPFVSNDSGSALTSLTDFGVSSGAVAKDINDKGLVLFDTGGGAGVVDVVAGTPPVMLPSGSGQPVDINLHGWVVGNGSDGMGLYVSKPPYKKLIPLLSGLPVQSGVVRAVNDHKQVVGDFRIAAGTPRHGFISVPGQSFQTVDPMPGADTYLNGVDNSGVIVGLIMFPLAQFPLVFACQAPCTEPVFIEDITPDLPQSVAFIDLIDTNKKGQILLTGSDHHVYLLSPSP